MDFRRVTDGEFNDIKNAAASRKLVAKSERSDFEVPSAAKNSVEGGIIWAAIKTWQDNLFFVIACTSGLLWNIFHAIVNIFSQIPS